MSTVPRILLVDDDEDDNVLVADLLSDAFGVDVRPDWAETFDAGLTAMMAGGHDVCLVDFRLGCRDGLDLVREAARNGFRAPIIFLTGQDCRRTEEEAKAAGVADYLSKDDISATALERSIRSAMAKAGTG